MLNISRLFGIVTCFISYIATAKNLDQVFLVQNNSTVKAVVSQREITRIIFDHDITHVNSIAGELEYNIDSHDLYLRISADKPINFFVKTEINHTYKFIVTAEDVPATQIFVKTDKFDQSLNDIDSNKSSQYPENLSPYLQKKISQIIDVSLNPRKYLGYQFVKLNKKISSPNPNLVLRQLERISNFMLAADKIEVVNISNEQQYLNPQSFFDASNLAIYFNKNALLPNEKAILIRISEK